MIDETNKIVAQVSSVKTKKKIENSLNKPLLENYTDFKFIFIVVALDAKNLKNKTYENPYNLSFDPKTDIYDIKTLLEIILHKDIEILENVYKFIMQELDRKDINTTKIDSNLASIINILALENLQDIEVNPQTHSFEIQKKIDINGLNQIQPLLEDYIIYNNKLTQLYKEFDKQGANKSLSILNIIRSKYFNLAKNLDSVHIYFTIIKELTDIIKNSKNYDTNIAQEELELCVAILVVDAFIRCKIFKKP